MNANDCQDRRGGAALAITWFWHRRTAELCEGLDVPLEVLATSRRGAARYFELSLRTLRLLRRMQPRVLFVQNPSLILACLAVLLRSWFGYRLVVDAHNEAVEPFINLSRTIAWLTRFALRKADLTIVTSKQLALIVEKTGGRAFVLPDRVPHVPEVSVKPLAGEFTLVLICTYAPDEPLREVIEAVRGLDVTLYVTGNKKRCDPTILASAPSNVVFTGFLAEEEYWDYLRGCDAIIDLTTMPNCLVCGGYEAAALGQALLLTRSEAAVDLFGDAVLYTDNSPIDIGKAVLELRTLRADLQGRMKQRGVQLTIEWNRQADALLNELGLRSDGRTLAIAR
jgi:hypothetical protein